MVPERAALARACALLGTAALVGGALLALFAATRASAAPKRVLLLDLSRSVRARWSDPGAVYARAAAERAGAQPIAFAAGALRCSAAELRGVGLDPSRSDLDAALELAREVLGPDGERTIEILSDGGFTGADPRPRMAALEREGVGFVWLPLPGRERAELVLGEPRAGEARLGAPVALALPLALARGAQDDGARTLSIEVEHAGKIERIARALAPPAGQAERGGWLEWPLRLELAPLGPGETRVRFALENDPLSKREIALWPAGGRARAAVLGPSAGLKEVPGGPEWVTTNPLELQRGLDGFDLLLTTDAAFDELPARELEAWLERGGAWIACASPRNFPQHWRAQELAELLPLEPGGDGLPPRDVVFLIDGSGSMAGRRWELARAALARLAGTAIPGERLYVRSFAAALGPAEPLVPGAPAADAPGGPTALCDALLALARESAERERLVVLLSDGQDSGGAAALARAPEIARALAGARIQLAAVAIGEDANNDLLRALLGPGQELLVCARLEQELDGPALAQLFQRQLGAREWARALPGLASSGAGPADLAAALAALDPARPVARCASTRARGGADVLLVTPEHGPALAIARVGLGWCVAAGFDPGQTAFDPWNTLAQFVAREPAAARPRLVLRPGRVRVENLRTDEAGWTRAELRGEGASAELALLGDAYGAEAALAPELERRAWKELVLAPGSARELALAWPQSLPAEERLPRPALEPAERADKPARLVARAGAEGPLARVLVGAGLALSFLAAVLGFFSRAGAPAGTKF